MDEIQNRYDAPVTLEQAEQYITGSLVSTAREYVAIGYWLRRIRDGALYSEDGYQSFEEYVNARYSKDKGWASKCIKVNAQLSVDGDSPVLASQYQDYSTYQLVELAYMTQEQREQASQDMTVKELREMRRPQIPVYDIPGQIEITDLLDAKSDAEIEAEPRPAEAGRTAVNVSELIGEKPAEAPEPVKGVCVHNCTLPPEDKGELSAYGTSNRSYPPDSLIAINGCEGGHDCFCCAIDCRIRQEERYCRYTPLGNPQPCETVHYGFAELGGGCQFVNHDLADPCCQKCDNPCEHICERAAKALAEDQKVVTSQPENAAKTQQNDVTCCKNSSEENGDENDLEEESSIQPAEYDRDILEDMIQNVEEALQIMQDDWIKNRPSTYTKHAMQLQAYRNLMELHDQAEAAEEEEPEIIQPDLPLMRNNEQRKEWLRNYQSWGLWYEDEHIGVRYYKFDFDNGARLIAEEYDYSNQFVKNYVCSSLHLVGGPEPPQHPSGGYNRWQRHGRYNRYPDSETELLEFLKAIQKGE